MVRIIIGRQDQKQERKLNRYGEVVDVYKRQIVQSSERNLYGRSVRLDALCILGNGKKCNVEVQRSNKDHHLKRVR